MLKLVESATPEIYPFVYQCYSKDFNLFFGMNEENYGHIVNSEEGVQQGDPLGPFLFGLIINHLIPSCESKLNLWFLDDGTIASDIDTVLYDYNKILEAGDTLGLNVNLSICELCLLEPELTQCFNALKQFCKITESVRLVPKEQLTLLGTTTLPDAIENMLELKLERLKLMA